MRLPPLSPPTPTPCRHGQVPNDEVVVLKDASLPSTTMLDGLLGRSPAVQVLQGQTVGEKDRTVTISVDHYYADRSTSTCDMRPSGLRSTSVCELDFILTDGLLMLSILLALFTPPCRPHLAQLRLRAPQTIRRHPLRRHARRSVRDHTLGGHSP